VSLIPDSQRLKPPRNHPSQFPVHSWAPVGFPGQARRLTSSLHRELNQGKLGRKETHGQASNCPPGTPSHGGWGLTGGHHTHHMVSEVRALAGPPRIHTLGSLALLFPRLRQPKNLQRAAKNCTRRPGPPQHPSLASQPPRV
jgi:hypothetical protein